MLVFLPIFLLNWNNRVVFLQNWMLKMSMLGNNRQRIRNFSRIYVNVRWNLVYMNSNWCSVVGKIESTPKEMEKIIWILLEMYNVMVRTYGDGSLIFGILTLSLCLSECVWMCAFCFCMMSKSLLAPNYNNYTFICAAVLALWLRLPVAQLQSKKIQNAREKQRCWSHFDRDSMRWINDVDSNYCELKTKQNR